MCSVLVHYHKTLLYGNQYITLCILEYACILFLGLNDAFSRRTERDRTLIYLILYYITVQLSPVIRIVTRRPEVAPAACKRVEIGIITDLGLSGFAVCVKDGNIGHIGRIEINGGHLLELTYRLL